MRLSTSEKLVAGFCFATIVVTAFAAAAEPKARVLEPRCEFMFDDHLWGAAEEFDAAGLSALRLTTIHQSETVVASRLERPDGIKLTAQSQVWGEVTLELAEDAQRICTDSGCYPCSSRAK